MGLSGKNGGLDIYSYIFFIKNKPQPKDLLFPIPSRSAALKSLVSFISSAPSKSIERNSIVFPLALRPIFR